MADAAILTLQFEKSVGVTVQKDNTWSASDPHSMLEEDSGKWSFHPTSGVLLSGKGQTQIVLVAWRLGMAKKGEEGAAFRFPNSKNELGSFVVDQVY